VEEEDLRGTEWPRFGWKREQQYLNEQLLEVVMPVKICLLLLTYFGRIISLFCLKLTGGGI